jgi:hypothetical protein
MKDQFLNSFLDNLRQESGMKKQQINEDLSTYLNDDEEEGVDTMQDILGIKQRGRVDRTAFKYTRGKTGQNSKYEVDFEDVKEILQDTIHKKFTVAEVKEIVKIVRLALGVGQEDEKKDILKDLE